MLQLTTKQKWADVDRILGYINSRKARGQKPCVTDLEIYLDDQFNKKVRKDNE